jgi:hypothetical protein
MADINDIARMMDQQDIKVLSLESARSLLLDKSKPDTSETLKHAALLENALKGFVMGSNNIGEVRTHAENLAESADDDLGLIYAVLATPEADRGGYSDHEIAPLGSMKFVDTVHNLMELTRGYLSGRCKGDMLCEAGLRLSQICYNAHRNASILETHHGPDFFLEHNFNPAPDAFDRFLVETVSSGAIGAAIVPAFVGGKKKQPKDIFAPKKKNRWYLKYAIE